MLSLCRLAALVVSFFGSRQEGRLKKQRLSFLLCRSSWLVKRKSGLQLLLRRAKRKGWHSSSGRYVVLAGVAENHDVDLMGQLSFLCPGQPLTSMYKGY